MSGRVARRYAKALFALAREGPALETVAAELEAVRQPFADPAVLAVLASPAMTVARLTALMQELTRHLHLSDLTARFLGVLAANRRVDQLPGICDRFREFYDRALGRVRVSIRSAVPLSAARQAEIVAAFERLTGKTVLATVVTDADLLGGTVVEAEGKTYDGSLRTQFEHLAREISSARTHL